VLTQNLGALGVVVYVWWETRHGKLRSLRQQVSAVGTVVIALARDHPDIDDDRVEQALVENGTEPQDFRHSEPESEARTRDEMKRKKKPRRNHDQRDGA
jgi:hypothetical protein